MIILKLQIQAPKAISVFQFFQNLVIKAAMYHWCGWCETALFKYQGLICSDCAHGNAMCVSINPVKNTTSKSNRFINRVFGWASLMEPLYKLVVKYGISHWRCTNKSCTNIELDEREVACWICGEGEMVHNRGYYTIRNGKLIQTEVKK